MRFLAIGFIFFISVSSYARSFEDETKAVAELLKKTVVVSKTSYCTSGKMDCRTHYVLKHRSNGRIAKAFYVTFMSADRQLGSTGYFLPVKGKEGLYHRYEDMSFDGKQIITEVAAPVEVEKNHDGSPARFIGMKIPRLGTSRYIMAEITVTAHKAAITGIEYDANDPNYRGDFKLEYNRVKP